MTFSSYLRFRESNLSTIKWLQKGDGNTVFSSLIKEMLTELKAWKLMDNGLRTWNRLRT